MLLAIIVHAFALVSIPANDPMPWDSWEFHYKSGGKSAKGRMPWHTESLNYRHDYPTVINKSF
jgi:hypothetical protein